jgi:hypothetical protein
MQPIRAVVALVLQLLLLHVGVAGSGMPCASATSSRASHGAMPHHRADHRTHHDENRDGRDRRDATPTHCAAAAACAVVAEPAPETNVAPVAIVERPATPERTTAPRWTHPAPEPPPPRA